MVSQIGGIVWKIIYFSLITNFRIVVFAMIIFFNMLFHVVAIGLWSGLIWLFGRQYRGCGGSASCANLLPAEEYVGHGGAWPAEASAANSYISPSRRQCACRPAPFHCLQVIDRNINSYMYTQYGSFWSRRIWLDFNISLASTNPCKFIMFISSLCRNNLFKPVTEAESQMVSYSICSHYRGRNLTALLNQQSIVCPIKFHLWFSHRNLDTQKCLC